MNNLKSRLKYFATFIFVYSCSCYSGDNYMHIPLCGYGEVNKNPCEGLDILKIYTGLPHGRSESLDKIKKLNALTSKWIDQNRTLFRSKGMEIELQNIGGKYYIPTPSETELAIGIFAYYEDSNIIVTLISSAKKSNQALSYLCAGSDADFSENSCIYENIDKGMRSLMEHFL